VGPKSESRRDWLDWRTASGLGTENKTRERVRGAVGPQSESRRDWLDWRTASGLGTENKTRERVREGLWVHSPSLDEGGSTGGRLVGLAQRKRTKGRRCWTCRQRKSKVCGDNPLQRSLVSSYC
jgi:hypothetical protein